MRMIGTPQAARIGRQGPDRSVNVTSAACMHRIHACILDPVVVLNADRMYN